MTGNLGWLALASAFLLATHFGIASTGLRAKLIGWLGERGYRAVYSLISLAAMVWLVMAYSAAPVMPVWFPDTWMWFVPLTVTPRLALPAAGRRTERTQPNGGRAGKAAGDESGPRGVLRITRNPVMWAIGLWALAHMVPNGNWASLLFFGTLAVLALLGSVLIDVKNAVRRGDAWTRWTQLSSNIPFVALIQGRQTLGITIREIGWVRLAVTPVLHAGLLHGHSWLFGVSSLPPV